LNARFYEMERFDTRREAGMKKTWIVGVMVVVLLIGGSAFAGEPIKLGMSTWLGYAPLYLAKEKGFFKKRGLEVEIAVVQSPVDRRAAFAADKIQGFATTVDTLVMTAAAETPIPVKQVLVMDASHGGDGIVARKEIKSLQELKGKTVAGQMGAGASYFWLNYVLAQNGMKLSDLKMVDMRAGDAGAAFVAGRVDAAVTWEPWLSRAKDTPHGYVLYSSDKTPGIIVDSLGFKPEFLASHGADVRKIVAAWNEAIEFAAKSPQEADAIMGKFANLTADIFAIEKAGVRFYGAKENQEFFGSPDKPGHLYSATQRAADVWFDLKLIKAKPKAADLLDASFLK
jgi:NitT/TauT family transport system substrate-binding protein